MKKVNLIERLFMDSHEEQSPQRFGRYAVMLIMLLTLSVGQMWANYAYLDLTAFTKWYESSAVFRVDKNGGGNVDSYSEVKSGGTGTGVWRFNIGDYTGAVTYKRMNSGRTEQWNYYNGSISETQNVAHITDWNSGSMQTSFVINYIHGTNYIYFDNSVSQFPNNIYFIIGKDYSPSGSSSTYSKAYKMSKVSNTNNLWYVSVTDTWEDATYFAIVADDAASISADSWGSSSLGSTNKGDKGYTAAYKKVYNMEGGSYLITTASSGNGQAITIDYKDGYSALNTTHTLNQTLSVNGGGAYSSSTKSISSALSISSNKMNNNGSTTSSSGSISSGSSSTTCDAARTATVSFSVTQKTGYTFVGWYESSTQKSTSTTWSFTDAANARTITARFKAVQSTITLAKNDGTGTSVTQTATYGETAASRSSARPTRTNYAFDGYYTAASGGTKVIDKNGNWVSNVSGFTDSNGKWICTSAQTLHAHWLETGWYIVGESDFVGGWDAQSAYKFDNTNYKCTVTVADHGIYSGSKYLKEFKICRVQENTSSAKNETLYGKSATIGKDNPTASGLSSGEYIAAIKEELYYDGDYIYTLNTSGPDITVAVPVVDQLQIYSSTPSGATGINNYNWTGPVSNNVTKTVTLAHSTTYEFKAVYDSEFYGFGTGDTYANLWRNTDSTLLATSKNNVKITTDIKGSYKFDYNVKTHKVKVTFPTRRRVTYNIVTIDGGTGTAGSLTATNDDDGNVNISTLDRYVADGDHVTFTAPTEATGYTWRGWYSTNTPSAADWSSGRLSSNKTYSGVSVSGGDLTVYAVYSQNKYDVSVSAGSHGSVSPSGTVAVKQITGTSITATADDNYLFTDWTISGGGITPTTSSTNPQTFKATTTSGTIQANFHSQWTIAGSMYNNFDWSKNSNLLDGYTTIDGKVIATVTIALDANETYTFKVKDRSSSADNTWWGMSTATTLTYTDDNTYKSLSNSTGNQNITLQTAAAGDYVFRFNLTDKKVAVDFPTSHLITSGVKTVYDPDLTNTSDATETGGTYTATDNSSNNVKGANKYVAASASVTFEATPNTGYKFDGWYTDAACTLGKDMTNPLTVSSISANVTRYAKFKEIMTKVSISCYGGTFKIDAGSATTATTYPHVQVGVHTTHKVTIASEIEGYYFAGWELSEGSTCKDAGKAINFYISGTASDEDNRTNVTITGYGDPDKCNETQYLKPIFKTLDQIYFRNVFNDGSTVTHWSNVYAFFDVSWNGTNKCAHTSSNNSSKGLHVQMEAIGTTGIYRAYVPRFATRYTKKTVAFADYDVSGDNVDFNPGSGTHHGSYRGDYSNLHNMFVPYHVKEANDGYYTQYYNKGYWMHYTISDGVNAGYWIEERKSEGKYSGKPDEQFVVLERAFENDPRIRYRLRIDGISARNYAIFSEGGCKYKVSSTIAYNNCTNITLTEDNGSDAYFTITPTAEGEYILTIDQSGDQMKLSVEYPIVAGDYVLEHTYTGKKKTNPLSDSTYVTRTNIIKSVDAAENTRYSMYLNEAGATLKLRKCTLINASGVPQWDAGTTTNVSLITDTLTKYGNGVYQFDMTINTSNHQISAVDSVRLYTGNFYIKTDAASGGWVSYKNNALTKNTVNFDREDASTFDYYMCKYFASKDCNIKSVIANDYCNQLSDTVKGDGIARMSGREPYVPIDGTSIRFSYNSATNETKRAYLGATYHNSFLNIVPSTDNTVYRTIGGNKYDLYDIPSDSAKLKFDDNGNYVYEMDLSVKPGAKAGVRAVYNTSHTQMLIPSTNTLLGGTGSSEYSIRVVYDFKTNFMMSAFVLTNTAINENLSDFDMLWVRHKDDSPTQLTLGADKSLSNVRPIGAIEFRYDEMCSSSTSPSRVDLSSWSAASRPYLKYFISFPFDVHVGSVFGLNDAYYDLDYVIQKYDGAKRAAEGLFFGDGDNYWVNMTQDEIMKANEGYCLILDNDYARWNGSSDMWYNKGAGSLAYIYFPAMEEIKSIGSSSEAGTKVPQHTCTINRWWANNDKKNHIHTDSHWNMIGQPFFHDAYIKTTTNAADTIPDLGSYYYLDYVENKWYPQAFDNEHSTIKAMSSIYVQWAGNITWTTNAANDKWKDTTPAAPAAPRRAKAEDAKNYLIQLDVEFNGKVSDWTFVRLIDQANDDYVLREDMLKMYNNGIPNIYTFAGHYDVAYNAVPVKSQTLPMGVLIRKNGTYKFSMPSNFSGTVTLIDKFAQTRTNLALDDYEVYLEKGTIDDRFELEINIYNAPTAIDGASDGQGSLKDGKAHKFIMNDMLYILKDGVLYDARGSRVK